MTQKGDGALRLHLIKLCVGCDAPEKLRTYQAERRAALGRNFNAHVTRMWPKRAEELLAGGSLYWVMQGQIAARQRIIGFEEVHGEDAVRRCMIKLDPDLTETIRRPRRPFQGWRYLADEDAPEDLSGALSSSGQALPAELVSELAALGVR